MEIFAPTDGELASMHADSLAQKAKERHMELEARIEHLVTEVVQLRSLVLALTKAVKALSDQRQW